MDITLVILPLALPGSIGIIVIIIAITFTITITESFPFFLNGSSPHSENGFFGNMFQLSKNGMKASTLVVILIAFVTGIGIGIVGVVVILIFLVGVFFVEIFF